ncbi:MAG TPA: phosphoribosylanthranilate isomerase [Rhodanobacteraceae bacterium]|nr:phosphoribosylanthranilate isomerase [Rhodanobacteraceae bacterium]
MRTRIKFCGIARTDDALQAVELGIDALGFVFTRASQRFIGITQARAIRTALPPFVTAVALFMDDEPGWIEEVVSVVEPDILQFHGGESDGFASSFSRPYMKAVPMASIANVARHIAAYPGAAGFLFDSHARGGRGGTGEAFDWSKVPPANGRAFVLAGGLAAQNVADAVVAMRPYGVDVSTGIESAPGIKDTAKMHAFVAAVRRADATRAP